MKDCVGIQLEEACEIRWGFHKQEPWSFLPFRHRFPSPRQPLLCFLSQIELSILEFHTVGIIQCTLLYILLLSLDEIDSCYSYQWFVPIYRWIVLHYMAIRTLLIHSFISWLTFELFPVFGYYKVKSCSSLCGHMFSYLPIIFKLSS